MADFKEENQTITLTIPTQGSIPVISVNNWIVFMQRDVLNGFSWNRTWDDYKNGFGSSGSEDFWMGLERLHLLTDSGSYRLRFQWQRNGTDDWLSFEYWTFHVDDEASGYRLNVSDYIPGDDGRVMCVYEHWRMKGGGGQSGHGPNLVYRWNLLSSRQRILHDLMVTGQFVVRSTLRFA